MGPQLCCGGTALNRERTRSNVRAFHVKIHRLDGEKLGTSSDDVKVPIRRGDAQGDGKAVLGCPPKEDLHHRQQIVRAQCSQLDDIVVQERRFLWCQFWCCARIFSNRGW